MENDSKLPLAGCSTASPIVTPPEELRPNPMVKYYQLQTVDVPRQGPKKKPTESLPTYFIMLQTEEWHTRYKKNRQQMHAVGALAPILVSGAASIAWSVGLQTPDIDQGPTFTPDWFIAAIIGAIISMFWANRVPTRRVAQLATGLIITAGFLFICSEKEMKYIRAALYIDGLANGLVFAPMIALIGELTVFYMRGFVAAFIEQFCPCIGICAQVIYPYLWKSTSLEHLEHDGLHGAIGVLSGIFAMSLSTFFSKESPVKLLIRGKPLYAMEVLRRVQAPNTLTEELFEQQAENKSYVMESRQLSTYRSITQALPALLRLCCLRALHAMSLAIFIVLFRTNYGDINHLVWSYPILGIFRIFGNLITMPIMELIGHRITTLIGLLLYGSMAFIMTSFARNCTYGMVLVSLLQTFSALAFTASPAFLSEAYPMAIKEQFIALTYIVEMSVYIFVYSYFTDTKSCTNYLYLMSIFTLLFCLLAVWILPETKRTTLREALEKFKGFVSKRIH
ncbi:uncharacterized protein LOC115622382 [Scaptodrosophila lebanonensis]|uniref:Uncharacterized protein LOC115622382 n=1 Tax=Drosophila lebanonensis TaxID=7225 RepID=A0A6J2T9Z9_DROLE|nr:uncharacterized protein LOC115622382 [Scaptodrosophila lebanonensis]